MEIVRNSKEDEGGGDGGGGGGGGDGGDLLQSSSNVLSEVPVEYAMEPLPETVRAEFKGRQQEALKDTNVRATQMHAQIQLQSTDQSSTELSPTSAVQSLTSIPSPTVATQNLSSLEKRDSICVPEVNKQNLSDSKITAVPIPKAHSSDGYNWRKYGQKQVKSPQGSRSYFRCTYSDCYAKKIECCDPFNRVVEIVYRSRHTHDPPKKVHAVREDRPASPVLPVIETDNTVLPALHSDSVPSTSSKEPLKDAAPAETKPLIHYSNGTAYSRVKEEHIDEPEPKKRLKKSSSSSCGESPLKVGKKPKFVVHAAGDVGISADGYRWRKYGQKMVKGNPHPRNYYRCTSAGCPVRKHTERAIDNTGAVVITYKGVHDHDMPVPKKRHGTPCAPLLAAAAPASKNILQANNSEQLQNQEPATQWSVDKEGELTSEALDTRGEKITGTKTLLSIGFEIKQC